MSDLSGNYFTGHGTSDCRSFAVIPAAGHSRRMGCPKLLLPWGDSTVIEQVLSAWRASGVEQIAVVVRPGDTELAHCCRQSGVDVVVPHADPAEMKDSVRLGLQWIRSRYDPRPTDAWLLAPADMPQLTATLVDRVRAAYAPQQPTLCLPLDASGRRGHPALFPWSLVGEVEGLRAGESIKDLLTRHPVCEVAVDETALFTDLDTPEDYQRWRRRL